MKVLFLGVYRDGTGWGHAASEYILAMDAADINVVPRAIKLNGINAEVHPRILELENQDDANCDVVVQCILPHMMEYDGHFKRNIGLCFIDTDRVHNAQWKLKLQHMDSIWVPCHQNRNAILNSGVTTMTHVIPIPTDTQKFEQSYEPLIPEVKDAFNFYYIGEGIRRKNIETLIRAFHLAFKGHEPVNLILKVSLPGQSPPETMQYVSNICSQIKGGLKLYGDEAQYRREIIIANRLSEQDLLRLHVTGHCFVSAAYNEAWGIDAFTAMGFCNTPIMANYGGPADYLKEGGFLVDGHLESCFGATDTFQDLHTAREKWYRVNPDELARVMRNIYLDRTQQNAKAKAGFDKVYEYSYHAIGSTIKKALIDEL